MSLTEYKRKRDFKKTPEPHTSSAKTKKTKKLSFVIQKHAASHLHYDFRLELDGTLKSWAVPKGPCLDPQQKRLAMQVEDHPTSYGKFEGIIPQGQYGGGTVMLWDNGTWEPLNDPKAGYKKGKLEFILHGKRLSGMWHLVRMKADKSGKMPWLLIKSHDESSRSIKDYDILLEETKSVTTNRSMEEIASNKSSKVKKKTLAVKTVKNLPVIKPQLATLVTTAPEGDDWIHEVKYDGYRILAYIEEHEVKLLTRNGKDITDKLPNIRLKLEKLKTAKTVFDGELVAIDQNSFSFGHLVDCLSTGQTDNLVYFIFDLPFYNGRDLRELPLLERKVFLKKIMSKKSGSIRNVDFVTGNGTQVYNEMCALKMEGIISKRTDSSYESKRTKTWLKLKCNQIQEFVIIGFAKSQHTERGIASLLLGYYDSNNKLQYCGHVGTGFSGETLSDLLTKLSKIKQKDAPFKHIPADIKSKHTVWVKPKLMANIKFIEWTNKNRLRHPVFLGLQSSTKSKAENNVATISNQDKILFPEKNITKGDLAEYYKEIGPWILPHIINRPLMILRCPNGPAKQCFFQKHYKDNLPKGLFVIDIREKNGTNPYIYIKDSAGLAAFAQLAVIEIHPWGSNIKHLEQPDRIVFDLDPAPDVPWNKVILAAERLRKYLLRFDLKSFVKTSGQKGLHIVVPLKPQANWDVIKEFSRQIALLMVEDYPDDYVATMTKKLRTGKIFIDFFRNMRGSTSVSAYSCRANASASVSVPISWSELKKIRSGDCYDLEKTLLKMRKTKIDPWKDFFEHPSELSLRASQSTSK